MFTALISLSKLVYKASIKYTHKVNWACLYKVLYVCDFTRLFQVPLEAGTLTGAKPLFINEIHKVLGSGLGILLLLSVQRFDFLIVELYEKCL